MDECVRLAYQICDRCAQPFVPFAYAHTEVFSLAAGYSSRLVSLRVTSLIACGSSFSEDDANEIAAEVERYVRVSKLLTATVHLSTQAGVSDTPEEAAARLYLYLEQELPCVAADLDEDEVSIRYGVFEDDCSYLGLDLAGIQTVTFRKDEDKNGFDEMVALSSYEGLNGGKVSISGTAEGRWARVGEPIPEVSYNLRWTDLVSNMVNQGKGNLTQAPMESEEGIDEGIQIADNRSWSNDDGKWNLEGGNVVLRWEDTVPQDGTMEKLQPPGASAAEVDFRRADEDTVELQVESNGGERFDLRVKTSN